MLPKDILVELSKAFLCQSMSCECECTNSITIMLTIINIEMDCFIALIILCPLRLDFQIETRTCRAFNLI